MLWQLRGGGLQNIFKTFRIKLRLMVWFTIIERASSERDIKEQQEASYRAGLFGMSATRLATNKWCCDSYHDSRVPMAALRHPWVWFFGSQIGAKIQHSNGTMLLADAKLENQNHKNQQKAVPESVNK
jgi:hypothetical protein